MWLTGLVALRHVGSSQTRARTRVPALAGRFSTTAPPGKPLSFVFKENYVMVLKKYMIIIKNLYNKEKNINESKKYFKKEKGRKMYKMPTSCPPKK